ncbi:MAG: PEP-CTERM sorting domain-containing protein [Armatimonadetes bacterium]|nr:PEP-CTERM sorting domain-containing protein [Armatimonadota bacterium]
MRKLMLSVLFALCATHSALAAYPVITTTINRSSEAVVYIYTLTNTSPTTAINSFVLFVPASVVPSLTSLSGPTSEWRTYIQGRGDGPHEVKWWVYPSAHRIQPGSSGDFTIVTHPDVPTGYDYAPRYGFNWVWTYEGGTGYVGNTILPVPVPEPSSLLALGLAASGLGGVVMRRRKR